MHDKQNKFLPCFSVISYLRVAPVIILGMEETTFSSKHKQLEDPHPSPHCDHRWCDGDDDSALQA